jgi:hypothetical protein
MPPRRSAVLSALCTEVLNEAKNTVGTWILAMHAKIDDIPSHGPASDVEVFVSAVSKRIISPKSEKGEYFKLPQLCTMARQKQYSNVD